MRHALALSVLLIACKSNDAGDVKPASTTAAAPPVATASATTTSSASAAPSGGAHGPGGLSILAHAHAPLHFESVRGATIVDFGGVLVAIEDGVIKQKPSLEKGLPKVAHAKVFGAWPDAAVAAVTVEDTTKYFKWVNEMWAETTILRDPSEALLDLEPWGDHLALAVVKMGNDDVRIGLAGGKPPGIVPAPTAGQGDDCPVKLAKSPIALAGVATGETFLFGKACGEDKFLAERIPAKKVHGAVDDLPVGDAKTSHVDGGAALAADDAYAFGSKAEHKPLLIHWDGKEWKDEATTMSAGVKKMIATSDGAWFAVLDTTPPSKDPIWRKAKGGAWAAIDLSGAGEISSADVAPTSEKEFSIALTTTSGSMILSTHASSAKPVEAPADVDVGEMLQTNRRWPLTDACVKPYAHLYTIGRNTDKVPRDFPALKTAFGDAKEFEGAQFVVEDDGANMYVGATAPTPEVARKIADAYRAKTPKAAPNVFCHEPIVKQPITLR